MKKILGALVVFCIILSSLQAMDQREASVERGHQKGLNEMDEWPMLCTSVRPILAILDRLEFDQQGANNALREELRCLINQEEGDTIVLEDCLRKFIEIIEELNNPGDSFDALPNDAGQELLDELLAQIRSLVVSEYELDAIQAELDALRCKSVCALRTPSGHESRSSCEVWPENKPPINEL